MSVGMQGSLFGRSLLLQSCWNFERMQSLGLGFCLEPWLARCWSGQGDGGREARLRHQEYFNTQPYMASLIVGMICAIEEEVAGSPAAARPGKIARLQSLKAAAASALAGLGDALFWGALRPFCAGLALTGALALGFGSWRAAAWAAAAGLIAYNAVALPLRWRFLRRGYEWKDQIANRLKSWQGQRFIRDLRWTGLALIWAAVALLLRDTAPAQRLAGVLALIAALALRGARVSAYRIYGGAVLAGLAASWAGWL